MTLTAPSAPPVLDAWSAWLEDQAAGDALPTHTGEVTLTFAVDLAVPPWVSASAAGDALRRAVTALRPLRPPRPRRLRRGPAPPRRRRSGRRRGDGAAGVMGFTVDAPVAVVRAERPATEDRLWAAVEFAVSVPPTADDRARWAYLAGLPALAGATWTSCVR